MIIKYLLADAEFGEDGAEDFVGRDLAGDFAQIVHALADVLGEEVAREAGLQAVEGAQHGIVGVHEGFVVAGVGDDYVVFAGLGQVDGIDQHRLEGVDVLVVRRREEYHCGVGHLVGEALVQSGELLPGGVVDFVDFVEGDDEVLAAAAREYLPGELLDLLRGVGGVDEPDDDGGLVEFLEGALDAHALDGVVGLADAGGVDEAEGDALQHDGVFDDVAGGAVDVGDEGAVFLDEAVEQGRFAGVGLADDGGGDAVFDGVAEAERVGEALDDALDFAGQVGEFLAVGKLYLLFAEVEFEFDERYEGEQLLAQAGELAAESATHLLDGQAVRGGRGGGDEVGHGFGLRQVELAVDEGAAGELAGGGQPAALAQQQGHDLLLYVDGAVARDFDGIFAGEGVGGDEEGGDDVVEGVARLVGDGAVVGGIGAGLGQRFAGGGMEYAVGDGDGLGAAHANDGDAASAGSGRDGTNGILGQGGIQFRFHVSIHNLLSIGVSMLSGRL